jgi:hypothetical protein
MKSYAKIALAAYEENTAKQAALRHEREQNLRTQKERERGLARTAATGRLMRSRVAAWFELEEHDLAGWSYCEKPHQSPGTPNDRATFDVWEVIGDEAIGDGASFYIAVPGINPAESYVSAWIVEPRQATGLTDNWRRAKHVDSLADVGEYLHERERQKHAIPVTED